MRLTGKQIIEENIITGYAVPSIQQQGVDMRIDRIGIVFGVGEISDKTKIPETQWLDIPEDGKYHLNPGYYEVSLIEGCNIPNNRAMDFKTRSSLVRCGAIVHSGQFDAGFKTNHCGCYLQVNLPICIDIHARICQAIVTATGQVEDGDLYRGQFADDKQRKS